MKNILIFFSVLLICGCHGPILTIGHMHVKKTDGSYAIGVDLGEIIKNNYPLLYFWTPEYLDPDVAATADPLWRRMRISYYGGDESGIRVLWNPDVAKLHLLFYNIQDDQVKVFMNNFKNVLKNYELELECDEMRKSTGSKIFIFQDRYW